MSKQFYNVKLKRGINQKWVKTYASSESNARYEAERQNAGWTVVEVQSG